VAGKSVLEMKRAGSRAALSTRFHHADLLDRVPPLHPRVQPAEERAYARDPSLFELQRHPGAGRLVWSSAVQDDVPIPRNLDVPIFDLFGSQSQGARDLERISFNRNPIAQIDNHHGKAAIDLFF